MHVSDLMHRHVVTAATTETISLAAQTMLWAGFRHLPVFGAGKLEGVLSEHDILRWRAQGKDLQAPVREAMSAPAIYCYPDESIEVAAERMTAKHVSCLPVVLRGDLLGIITSTDLMRAHVANLETPTLIKTLDWCAEDVMSKSPVTVSPDEHLIDAIAKMSQASVRHLPVVDGEGRLIGILSDRDVLLAAENLRHGVPMLRDERKRVRAAMSPDVVSVHPDAEARVLLLAFRDWRLGALPVVDASQRLVGIISYVDVLSALTRGT